jgi:hypothetical protein
VVEKKKIPSPKEDSVTDLGQNFFPERTRQLTSDRCVASVTAMRPRGSVGTNGRLADISGSQTDISD